MKLNEIIVENVDSFNIVVDAITKKIQQVTGYDNDSIVYRDNDSCRWAVPDEDDEVQIEAIKNGDTVHLDIAHTKSRKNKIINQYNSFDPQTAVEVVGKSLAKLF